MAEFITLENIQECESRFQAYMRSKHGASFKNEAASKQLRQLIYYSMQDVAGRGGDKCASLRAFNNATLNATLGSSRDMLSTMSNQPTQQPTLQNAAQPTLQPTLQNAAQNAMYQTQQLVGENNSAASAAEQAAWTRVRATNDLMGYREMRVNELIPREADARGFPEVGTSLKLAQREREVEHASPLAAAKQPAHETVASMDADEFEASLTNLERARQMLSGPLPPPMTGPEGAASVLPLAAPAGGSRSEALLPPPKLSSEPTVKYLTLSGCDRNLNGYPMRYKFSARTGGQQNDASLQGTYSNIAWIEATRVVMPMEAVSAAGSVLTPKGWYNIEFSMAFPYLVLCVGGLEGGCDGTNALARRALCTLVYDRDYKAPNGRGYLVLKPAQKERKVYPTPLATLPDLLIDISKPNGTLFNNSTDNYKVASLAYEPQNRLYLRIVLDKYFDRNEYWVGDYVRMSGLRLSPGPAYAGSPIEGNMRALEAYVNRPQGFEIVQLGASNDQGFVRSFYVLAPGVIDQTAGSVVIDANLVGVANGLRAAAGDPSATVVVADQADLLNASLQAVVMMRVGCLHGEAPVSAAGVGPLAF